LLKLNWIPFKFLRLAFYRLKKRVDRRCSLLGLGLIHQAVEMADLPEIEALRTTGPAESIEDARALIIAIAKQHHAEEAVERKQEMLAKSPATKRQKYDAIQSSRSDLLNECRRRWFPNAPVPK
jgi:hypothetical protein